jgi:phospholipase/carboxylesterase
MKDLIKRGEGKKAILMLHGRGGDAHNILSISHNFKATCYALTAYENEWYPHPFMLSKKENEPKLSESIKRIKEALEYIKKSHDEVYVLGFSQGACLALELGALEELAGVVAFSGGFIGEERELTRKVKTKRALICCSFEDPFIPLERAEISAKIYEDSGAEVLTNFYEGRSHHITIEDMNLAKDLINKKI